MIVFCLCVFFFVLLFFFFMRGDIVLDWPFLSQTKGKTKIKTGWKNDHIFFYFRGVNGFLVSKETVVLCRWER